MATTVFYKRGNAPLGPITIQANGHTFVIDDGANTTITTTDDIAAAELSQMPFLTTDPSAVNPVQGPPSVVPTGPPNWAPNTRYIAGALVIYQGVLYQAIAAFTSGASFNLANWTVIGGPTELGYTQVTSNSPASPFINSTSYIAITGYSITVSTGARPIRVDVKATVQQVTTTAPGCQLAIFEDGVEVASAAVNLNAQFSSASPSLWTRRNPAAGSHTYDVRGKVNGASNTAWLLASASGADPGPGGIQVVQL